MDNIYEFLRGRSLQSSQRLFNLTHLLDDAKNLRYSIEFRAKFSQTTDSERVKFVLNNKTVLLLISKLVKQFKSEPQDGTKSAAQANSIITEGKEALDNFHFDDAIEIFTNAIRYAPQGETALLSLAYGYRSSAYFHLQHYENAIKDIDIALKLHQNPTYSYILCKCKCLCALGRVTEAEQVIQDSSQHLPLNFARTFGPILREQPQIEIGPNINESVHSELFKNVSSVIKMLSEKKRFQPQSTLSSVSTKIKVHYDKKNGHHLVTTEDIQFGDILAVTKPYASVMTDMQERIFCHHCVESLQLPGRFSRSVPCERCSRVVYCSEKCRSDSWESYHRVECPLLPLATERSCLDQYLAFRTYLISGGLNSIRDIVEKCEDRLEHQLIEFTDNPEDYENVYQLPMTTKTDREPKYHHQEIEDIIVMGLLAKLTQTDTARSVSEQFDDDEILATKIMLRHLSQIRANGWLIPKRFAQSDNSPPSSSCYKFFTVLDPLISLLNSSCCPNISIITVDSDLINDDANPNCFGSNVLLFFAHQPIKANSVLSAMLPWERCEESWCPCHQCDRDRMDNPYGPDETVSYRIVCGDRCDGLLRKLPPNQITPLNHYKCSKCNKVFSRKWSKDIFDRMTGIEEKVVKLLEQIEEQQRKNDFGENQIPFVEHLLNSSMSPLWLPHNGSQLSAYYNRLFDLSLHVGFGQNRRNFYYVKLAWNCVGRSINALEKQFGGNTEVLLRMLRDNVNSFGPVVNWLRSELVTKQSLDKDGGQDERTMIDDFEGIEKRIETMQDMYKLV